MHYVLPLQTQLVTELNFRLTTWERLVIIV